MEEVVVLEMAGKQRQFHLVLRPKYGVPNLDQQGKTHLSHSVLQERLSEMERRLLELVHEKHEVCQACMHISLRFVYYE
jgi:hypothetical protein